MRRHAMGFVVGLAALGACAASPAIADPPPAHPRLIINPERIASFRDALAESPTTEREQVIHLAYRSIIAGAEFYNSAPPFSNNWLGQGATFQGMMTLGLAHQLRVGSPGYTGKYAVKAIATLDAWRTANPPFPHGTYGDALAYGEMLAAWSVAYDWFYAEMDSTQRANARAALWTLVTSHPLTDSYGSWTSGRKDNNHLGVAFGGRGLACLALEGDELPPGVTETQRGDTLEHAAGRVRDYLTSSYQGDGAGVEGVFYANYGMSVALPFALATERLPHLDETPQYRVDVTNSMNAQQAGTWMVYEQLPYYPYGGTPLNDTATPPDDFHVFRSWCWLPAFGNVARPSGAKYLFQTMFPPGQWAAELAVPFNPDTPDPEGDGIFFSRIPGSIPVYDRTFNAAPILLGWPDDSIPSAAFYDEDDMPPSRAFTGRGLAFWRSSLHSFDAGMNLDTDPDGTLITFECRNKAQWSGNHYHGHAQQDLGQFTLFAYGAPLFYDSGDGTGFNAPISRTEGHNLHEININGVWTGYYGYLMREGALLRARYGTGEAPTLFSGDATEAWNNELSPGNERVDRSQRHFLVMPRGDEAPYVVVYDDLDYAGSTHREARWFWHSAIAPDGPCGFELGENSAHATLFTDGAAAKTTILSPTGASLSLDADGYPPLEPVRAKRHLRLVATTGLRANADLVMLIDPFALDGSCEQQQDRLLETTTLTTSHGSQAFAYKVSEFEPTGNACDVVAFRRGGLTGAWTITVGDKTVSTDAQAVVLRFSSPNLEFATITSGMLIQGTKLWFDDFLVAETSPSGTKCDLVFSPEKVTVDPGPGLFNGYFVGPVIPQSARVSGSDQAVTMLPYPHPLQTTFPVSVGRSPKNDCASLSLGYRYDVRLNLKNWAGVPLSGVPTSSMRMDLIGCQNPSSNNAPVAASNAQGLMIFTAGLATGGSYESAGTHVVTLLYKYGDGLHHRFKTYAAVSSPDEDGDGDIDVTDEATFNTAYANQGPLYQADLNHDGVISVLDTTWFQQHKSTLCASGTE